MIDEFIAESVKGHFERADLFEQVDSLQGDVYRQLEGRKTLKVRLGERSYFAKIHFGVGWAEILKNLLQGRLPVLGARNEWLALDALRDAGVPTMTPVLFCEHGLNPAARKSAILTEALESKITLEDFTTDDPLIKRRLIEEVALMAKAMHDAGVNHRDFYLCHFLMDEDEPESARLHLIDLHRAQIRAGVPRRWLVKDLGGLLFSAFDKQLTRRDLLRFLRVYFNGSLRDVLADQATLLEQVVQRAIKLYLQDHDCLSDEISQLLGRK